MKKEIIYIPKLQYKCYFFGNGWEIIHGEKEIYLYINSFYSYPFYVVFENIEIVSEQLIMFIDKNKLLLSDFFPIELILTDMVDHKQGYWLNLGIDFIIRMNYLNENIVRILIKTKHDKSFSQELRHKIKRILLLNNFEY